MSDWKESRIITALICVPLCALGVYWGICAITGTGFFEQVYSCYFNYSSSLSYAEYVFLGGVLPGVMIAFAIASVCLLGLIIHRYAYAIISGLMVLAAIIINICAIVSAATDDTMEWQWYMVLLVILAFFVLLVIEAVFLAPAALPVVLPFDLLPSQLDPYDNCRLANVGITLLWQMLGHLALAIIIFLIRTVMYMFSYLMESEFGYLLVIGGIILALLALGGGGYATYRVIIIVRD